MTTTNQLHDKQIAACESIKIIESGMYVGLGSGSTALFAVEALGKRIKNEGLNVQCIPTSKETQKYAEKANIPLIDFSKVTTLNIAIDGADEICPQWNLTKGAGGCLLREKIVANAAQVFIVIADYTKCKKHLGQYPIPVEVTQFGWQFVQQKIQTKYALESKPALRLDSHQMPLITDNGNYILDCHFQEISDPATIAQELLQIPGILEHGLFINMVSQLIIAKDGKLINF